MKRVFLTGASGCIGHYIADELFARDDLEVFLLVRDPRKLKLDWQARPGVQLLVGDLREIDRYRDLLATIDTAILAATAWGDPQTTYDINVTQTLRFLELLDPATCRQAIYFSTASILNYRHEPLPEAGAIGTDYIRTKYECFQRLGDLELRDRLTVVFPTLVLGGGGTFPESHISAGLPAIARWVSLVRWFKADGSFHFIHARDIARVVAHLIDSPPPEPGPRRWVLGNPCVTANQLIEAFCTYLDKRIYFRIPLSFALASFLVTVLPIQMAAWDRHCLRYRHFTHRDPVAPASLGLSAYCPTLKDVFELAGIPPGRRPSV
ncbi:nucleoside-diphosphate-sugar epimerase [Rubidibacter lacunae KORDI 51-2]|uniref:Nucleoside-diphosphate-sugar epimerase n=1 Tax=Rubidibacter lacunae KORDI 51-2 TaxID=582515 RepID=U5DJG9_9CHRO|nr:NAD(P)-dependent oxidoreductase [Rubidibacter lacunae]ERN41836.1 nucleoside-diphosphate-sugar epimerase [Rubidibacter lacunae KORDI 51-2]